jgi:acetylglutamate/LysW-gamma-L-alpha-aminoadipate kinase
MVYCGQVNKNLVERLQRRGINAIGLSGIDGRLWQGPRKKAIRVLENGRKRIIRNNHTGRVDEVNTKLLHDLLDGGLLPLLTPPAISYDGEAMNVDGDRAAAATAVAMGAAELIILSNIPGVMRNFPDESSLIPCIAHKDIEEVTQTAAAGRMRIKLLGAREALSGGVGRVVLGDARGNQPVRKALAGQGTVIS